MSYAGETPEARYAIEQDDEILLYGFNLYCKEQADMLTESGYRVIGIIDKNTDGKEKYREIPVVNSAERLSVSEKTCVFIMLQNGILHWEIVKELYLYGVRRAVFLPMKTDFYNDDIQNEFIIQYNYMMEGAYSVMKVPYLKREMFETTVRRCWKPARQLDNGEAVIWIEKDLVRTTLREEEKYRDIPITGFTPYMSLFSCLAGDEKDISEYVKLYGLTPFPETSREARDYVLVKRHDLYAFFEDKYCSGSMDYFVVAAPKAIWNTKGYLNLCEGQHRCVYLLTKGMDYLPVRVDQTVIDYLNQERRDKLRNNL